MCYIEHFNKCVCFFMSWCLLHLAVICAKSSPEGIRSSYHFVSMELSKTEKGVLVKSKKLLHALAGKSHRFSNISLGYSQRTSLHTCVCMYLLQNTFTTAFAFLCPDAFYTTCRDMRQKFSRRYTPQSSYHLVCMELSKTERGNKACL